MTASDGIEDSRMTNMNEEKHLNSEGEDRQSEEAYSFIKETRKKQPKDLSGWGKRILVTVCLGLAAGLLAGLMFVLSVPVFQKLLNRTVAGPEKIEIAAVAASSEDAEEEPVEEEEPEKEPVVTPEDEQKNAIDQYNTVYQGMSKVAKKAQSAIVEVVGITSSLDYFNQNYENRQSLSGLLVAESQTSLYCLTENRSLKKAEKIQIIFCNGERVNAELKASDRETNLAILSISRSEIDDETWNSISVAEFGNYSTLRQGTPIIAVGSILGLGDSLEYGFITSVNNTVSLWDVNYSVLTTDMIGGSAGSGCLLNLDGEVVGLINQSVASEDQNLVTALPVKQLSELIEDLINGTAQNGIGIKGQTVSSEISESSGIPRGVLVMEVEQESPAMYAGIKELDVITALDGESVNSFQDYRRILGSLQEGSETTVSAMRMGKGTYEEISFRLKLQKK